MWCPQRNVVKNVNRTKSDWSRRSLRLVGGRRGARDCWLYTPALLGDWPAPSHAPQICAFWAQRMHDPIKVRVPPEGPIFQRIRCLGSRTVVLHSSNLARSPHVRCFWAPWCDQRILGRPLGTCRSRVVAIGRACSGILEACQRSASYGGKQAEQALTKLYQTMYAGCFSTHLDAACGRGR
ncbi:uncharacterized protein CC84DRAFT_1167985 [Paraphaeosphaeria sporulosa]|uniref:Uncharacterized protein n=1 Tax=Paraphaeosphaeria sporulosa TaxID=1460663 RepID=A0A177C315_9PLEO|nr:uncharacterized protein CC84DRAFT_1167985 [Paraphaeosphaeria sporulosa]OAG01855.1 hypothetical protein CC84DRAFT_1167985 [Paraphaeosphaeria sporulosa]